MIDASQKPTIEKNGWELAVNGKNEEAVETGDLVKITVIAAHTDDTDEPVRSVTHHPFWVKIAKKEKNILTGVLKSGTEHHLRLKDRTKFTIGEKIVFLPENILKKRGQA